VALAFGAAYWEAYQLKREEIRLIREQEQYDRQNNQLREEIRLLKTPEYIERLAREQLGLVKQDEIAVILVEPPPAPPALEEASPTPSDGPWWSRWLKWFGR
jgi:cell division protein FtsB